MRAFRYRDFRLLWTGAFLSFIGSWIQGVAQGWHVNDLTHDAAILGLVSFCGSAPVAVFGIFAGTLTDTFNKRTILVIAQSLFGLGALFLFIATEQGFVRYWHIMSVALLFGLVGCVEMPTRQSLVGKTVPPEELAAAIPINAMTFNLARVVGPAIGGMMLASLGPGWCYFANAVSYLALIAAVVAIRADTRPAARDPQPIKDLILEGMLFTMRDIRLRTLFILEACTSAFGLIYLALLPAVATDILHMDKPHLGYCYTWIGIGAVSALLTVSRLAYYPIKANLIRIGMTLVGLGMWGLGSTTSPIVAYALFALMGLATVSQFNVTNALFQTLSPERLRGRVLSMHIWALSGIGPFGTLLGGYLAKQTSISLTLKVGGWLILAVALWGWTFRRGLEGVG